jgi:hypothetical protein
MGHEVVVAIPVLKYAFCTKYGYAGLFARLRNMHPFVAHIILHNLHSLSTQVRTSPYRKLYFHDCIITFTQKIHCFITRIGNSILPLNMGTNCNRKRTRLNLLKQARAKHRPRKKVNLCRLACTTDLIIHASTITASLATLNHATLNHAM